MSILFGAIVRSCVRTAQLSSQPGGGRSYEVHTLNEMENVASKTSVKVVGSNGQISLGKEFAGRQVLVEEQEPGVWLIRTAQVVPDNELWLHQPQAREELQRALEWAQRNPPKESDLEAVAEDLGDGGPRKSKKRKARP